MRKPWVLERPNPPGLPAPRQTLKPLRKEFFSLVPQNVPAWGLRQFSMLLSSRERRRLLFGKASRCRARIDDSRERREAWIRDRVVSVQGLGVWS